MDDLFLNTHMEFEGPFCKAQEGLGETLLKALSFTEPFCKAQMKLEASGMVC